MASTKRNFPYEQQVLAQPKKAKESASEILPSPRVILNPADCDLDFNIECNGVIGYGLNKEGFSYCWSGARANAGITRGRYCFGCKVVSEQHVVMDDTAPDQRHLCLIGVSRGDDEVRSLGESKNSFGFSSTGKFSNAGILMNFGDNFGVGDTIVCCIDLESKPLASIGFSKNGIWLGTANQFHVGGVNPMPLECLPWGSALFPHVLLKNVMVEMQFSVEDGLVPQEGFKPWALAVADGNAVMGPILSPRTDCEVIMMVGLPASGKTTWVQNWVKDHPEKRYVLLGIDLILDKMKVPELLRRNNNGGRFDHLIDRANGILIRLLSKVATIPRNYIIDQANVYLYTRKHKLKPFAEFHKYAVVVFPKPEELKIRSEKRYQETGKEVPIDVVKDMIANYILPKSKDMLMPFSYEYFDQVVFVELNRDESQKHLDQMRGYPLNRFSHLSRSLYTRNVSNEELSSLFTNNECWSRIRGVLTTDQIENLVAGRYVPRARSRIVFHGDILNACRSGMNIEPSPVESARTISFDDSTHDDNNGLQPDTSPSTTTDSVPGRYASQHPRHP